MNWLPKRNSKTDVSSIRPCVGASREIVGCVIYFVKDGATLLIGAWYRENNSKLVE